MAQLQTGQLQMRCRALRVPCRRRMDRVAAWRGRPRHVLLAGMGVIPPDTDFLLQVAPADFQKNMGKKYWPKTQAHILSALQSGRLPAYTMEVCAKIKPLDKKTLITNIAAQAAGGIATAAGVAAGVTGAVVPGISIVSSTGAVVGTASTAPAGLVAGLAAAGPFLLVGAVILGVVAAIFAHHAKAVALEQSTLCGAIPGANDALAWIDSEFYAGRISKPNAAVALDELLRNFDKYVQPILKDTGNGKVCNYACGTRRTLTAIVAKKKAEYADAPDSILAAITSGSMGEILPWAAAAAVALMVMQ